MVGLRQVLQAFRFERARWTEQVRPLLVEAILAMHRQPATAADNRLGAWKPGQPNHAMGQAVMMADGGKAMAWTVARTLRAQARWVPRRASTSGDDEDDVDHTMADAALTLAVLQRMVEGTVVDAPGSPTQTARKKSPPQAPRPPGQGPHDTALTFLCTVGRDVRPGETLGADTYEAVKAAWMEVDEWVAQGGHKPVTTTAAGQAASAPQNVRSESEGEQQAAATPRAASAAPTAQAGSGAAPTGTPTPTAPAVPVRLAPTVASVLARSSRRRSRNA